MIDKAELVALYKEHKSYTKVAKLLGVSKQRINELLRKSSDPMVITIRESLHYKAKRCIVCNRSFRRIKRKTKYLCGACVSYRFTHKPDGEVHIRTIFYPKNCPDCKKKLIPGKRVRGYCDNCYRNRFVRHTKHYREVKRDWYFKNKGKVNEKQRKYYFTNIGHIREYMKQYVIKKLIA